MTTPRKTVLNTKGYDIPLYLDDFKLKLDGNESEIGPSPKVLEAIHSVTREDIKYYPAYGELLTNFAEYNHVNMTNILPTNGADEAISYIFDTFIDAEDTVLAVTPTFVMPKIYANNNGCNYKEVNYTEKWVFPVDEVINQIDEKTKLITVTTPNNPTGEAISEENMVKILDAANGKYVMIDETYASYAEETFVDLLKEYENLFIVRSMSKDFGLAGLRVGYIVASEKNIEYMKRVIKPYCVNNIAAKAACAAISDVEHLKYVISQVKESKEILKEGLSSLAEKVYPSDANFLLVDFGEKAEFIYQKLLNAGIKVKSYGQTPDLKNCLRIGMPAVKDTQYILDTLKSRDMIIFDMDGVLVDTSNSYRSAIRGTYEAFSGKTLTSETVNEAKARGGLNNDWDLTYYLLEKEGINVPFDQMIEKFQELYWGNSGDGFILNESILLESETIAELSETFDLAIFTGRPRLEAEFVLKRWNIGQYFSPVICMEDPPKGMGKPNPWGVQQISRVANPKEVYYLGDTVDDMFAAKQGGVKGIGVLPPQEKTKELKRGLFAHGAVEVLENTKDLLQLLQKFKKISPK